MTTARYGTPSLVLMENAAAETARAIRACGKVADQSVLVLCGPGNNGGDGAATARLLALDGAKVDVVLLGKVKHTKGDAQTNFDKAKSLARDGRVRFLECETAEEWSRIKENDLAKSYSLVVDALFGTGVTRPLEGAYVAAVDYLRAFRQSDENETALSPRVVSIDIPSGLNSDSAHPIGPAVQADITISMTAPKPANVLPPAAHYNGRLVVADIGSPDELVHEAETRLFVTEKKDARRWLTRTRYLPDSYKNTHGHVLVVAGSRGFTGAAALSGNAAMRSGAGLVTVATPLSAQPLVAAQVMAEVMTAALAETDRGAVSDEALKHLSQLAERATVIAIGPGLSAEDERTRVCVRSIVERRSTPVVVDADGLNCLAPWPANLHGSTDLPVVITPHPGEMLRLMGSDDKSLLEDRVEVARKFAMAHDVIVVLKGARPLIAAPDGRVFINPTGNAGLGTAGSGDTLTGVIAGFLAQAYAKPGDQPSAVETAIAALYISGLAGDLAAREIGMRSMVASDVRDHLGAAICALDPDGEIPAAGD